MKKNITTIIIMALVALNVVLSSILIFVMMPAQSKVNTLVTDISNIVKLELETMKKEDTPLSIVDQEIYTIDKKINITLKQDTDGKLHYAGIDSISITMNTKASSYKNISSVLEKNRDYITEIVQECYSKYTLATATTKTEEIKKRVLDEIIKYFDNTDCITNISFGNLRFQ